MREVALCIAGQHYDYGNLPVALSTSCRRTLITYIIIWWYLANREFKSGAPASCAQRNSQPNSVKPDEHLTAQIEPHFPSMALNPSPSQHEDVDAADA